MKSMFMLMLADTVKAAEDIGNLMNSSLTFAERIRLGAEVLFFGMGVVFAVLLLIWAILTLFKVIFYDIPNKKKSETEINIPVIAKPRSEPVVVATKPAPVPAAEPDETELIAAITAALAMVIDGQSDKPQTSFRVVSFRRTASK